MSHRTKDYAKSHRTIDYAVSYRTKASAMAWRGGTPRLLLSYNNIVVVVNISHEFGFQSSQIDVDISL